MSWTYNICLTLESVHCVCVCVCERERERERDLFSNSNWQDTLNISPFLVPNISDGMPSLPFSTVPTVAITRSKIQFAMAVLVHRWSLELFLSLIRWLTIEFLFYLPKISPIQLLSLIYIYINTYIYILNKKTQTELKKSCRLAKPFLSSGVSKQIRYQRNLKQFCNILEIKTKWLSIEKNQSVKWSLKTHPNRAQNPISSVILT